MSINPILENLDSNGHRNNNKIKHIFKHVRSENVQVLISIPIPVLTKDN